MKVPVISIVDDDESFRKAATSFVRSLGYAATAYASAEEFLTAAPIGDTDCLITDVQMPGMTGIELQDRLNSAGPHCPVIVVTASPDATRRARALAAGAAGVLGKPFSDETLIACLDDVLAGR